MKTARSRSLKALQGMIWAGGYASGELVAHLYDDAVAALKRWAARRLAGLRLLVRIDRGAEALLRPQRRRRPDVAALAGYFDTSTGPKQETDSYRTIAGAIGAAPSELLFLSDVAAELDGGRPPLASRRSRCVASRPPEGLFEPSITYV